jgi:predicted AlkP superfamily phosphohydrolase/phosphomutase
MRALLLTSLVMVAACGADTRPAAPEHRLLVVGWDGASYRMLDRLVADGRLPTVHRLLERGSSARLESTVIPLSAAAWTSAFTGKGPGDSGVYTFFEPVEGTYDVRLVSARSNRATPVWRMLTRRGLRSIVFGVPLTYPPEPILGTMVAGMLSPFEATYAWPAEYGDALRARGFVPDLDVWREARTVGWSDFERQMTIKEEALIDLLGGTWDFAMVVFKSLDVVSHLTYDAKFDEAVAPVYERLDAILGRLLEVVGPRTNVLLVSDHGFHVYPAGFNLHAWLVRTGWSVRRDDVKRFDVQESDPLARRERQIILQLRNELDWARSRAFAVESEGNFGALRLNVTGREPEGIVARDEMGALLDELAEGLRAVVDADGRPVVRRVFRGAELYPGPHQDRLVPDLLFETDPDCQVFSDVAEEGVVGPYGIHVPDHDRTGILIAAGPSLARSAERGDAAIVDLAPTMLHLLGQPVYAEMTGRALTELLRPASRERPVEVLREADDPRAADAPPPGEPFTPEELDELEERLRRLGYGE